MSYCSDAPNDDHNNRQNTGVQEHTALRSDSDSENADAVKEQVQTE